MTEPARMNNSFPMSLQGCGKYFSARSTRWALFGVAATSLALVLAPRQMALAAVSEGRLIESASFAAFGLGAILATVQWKRQGTFGWASAALALLWACLRELDYQKVFTYRSIESIGFYTSPQAAPEVKAAALLVLLPFVVAGAHLLWTAGKHIASGLSARATWVSHLFGIAVLVNAALVCEKLIGGAGQIVEEVCELGAAVLLLFLLHDCMKGGGRLPRTAGDRL